MLQFGGRGMINRGSTEHVLEHQTFTGLALTSNEGLALTSNEGLALTSSEGLDDLGQVISSPMTKFSLCKVSMLSNTAYFKECC